LLYAAVFLKGVTVMTETKFWEQLKSGKFAQMVRETTKGKEISNAVVAHHILKPLFAKNDDVETVYCIFLDGQNRILEIEKMFSGTINCATVFPREIVKRVVALRAGAVLMAHNHPSGDTTPSNEDRALTKRVIFSLMVIDVLLHDHLIVGNGYHSLSDEGWMHTANDQCRKFIANPT
jgi:DNA repair protein RadC